MADKLQQNVNQEQLVPSYSFTFAWEENFDHSASVDWFKNNLHVPFIIAILIYLPILYFGQMIMNKREPKNIKLMMLLWNGSLALFSLIGFSRVVVEMSYTLSKFGFQHTLCNKSYIHSKPCRFWIYLFVLSKIPELCDTIFLVLRKQKLIFLHVYHHATVLIYSWFIYAETIAAARWFCTMNFGIHAVMYSYYALKALPGLIRIPKWISMIITALQTLQMVAGSFIIIKSLFIHLTERDCGTSTPMSIFGLAIYTSYLVLFSHFFYNAYCSAQPPKEAKGTLIKKRA